MPGEGGNLKSGQRTVAIPVKITGPGGGLGRAKSQYFYGCVRSADLRNSPDK
jgi:hypothetical protein